MNFNFGGQLVSLDKPLVMGILNITPDSFFDGGKHNSIAKIVDNAGKMLEDGASLIDVGGFSSRLNCEIISVDEELSRLLPVVEAISQAFPSARLSIDTFRSAVVKAVHAQCPHLLVNDISAGMFDADMFTTIAKLHLPYCMMHLQGNLQTMHDSYQYRDLIQEVIEFFAAKLQAAHLLGICDIFIDPGFGFSKSIEQNYILLRNLEKLQLLDHPLLVGLSRKSMIYRPLQLSPQTALNGTTALNMIALQKGAKILRVHDVAEAIQCVLLWQMLEQ